MLAAANKGSGGPSLEVEWPTWVSAKQLQQRIMFKVGRRTRNGRGTLLVSCLYRASSNPCMEARSVVCSRPCLLKKAMPDVTDSAGCFGYQSGRALLSAECRLWM